MTVGQATNDKNKIILMELKNLSCTWDDSIRVLTIAMNAHYNLKQYWKFPWDGFTYLDCPGCTPWDISKLLRHGILKCVSPSGRRNTYRMNDVELVYDFIRLYEEEQIKREATDKEPEQFTPPSFRNIIGYDDLKSLLQRTLVKDFPTHFIFMGPPSSAKSMFLMEIEKLPNSAFALGSTASKSGIGDLLRKQKPRFLIIDEIDKAETKDLAILLSLMQDGTISKTKSKDTWKEKLNTSVFLAGNRSDGLPEELFSRAFDFTFKRYDADTFKKTVHGVLTREYSIDESIADAVADHCLKDLKTRDIREAIRIARLVDSIVDVKEIVEILKRYRGGRR